MTPILIGCAIATAIMFSLFFVAGNLDALLGRETPLGPHAKPKKSTATQSQKRTRPIGKKARQTA